VISYVYQAQVEQAVPLRQVPLGRLAASTAAPCDARAVLLMAVGAAAAGLSVAAEVFDPAALPANLLMLHAWGFAPSAAFNHPSWSISAEWFAYLTFPAFAAVALRFRNRPALAVGLAALLVLGLYAGFERLAGFPLTQATIHWGALRIVPCFALGCAVHLLWRAQPLGSRAAAAALTAASVGVIALLATLAAPDALLTVSFGALIFGLASLWTTRPAGVRPNRALSIFAYLVRSVIRRT
jgi:peptidoglycan/LPS O-acetylase OafA/YrhL